MLQGKELLAKVKEMRGQSKEDIALYAGYVKRGKPDVIGLLEAIASAKGVSFEQEERRGKQASYLLTVHTTGQVVVGTTYVNQLGLKPGDWLKVELKRGSLVLTPTEVTDEEVEEPVEEEEDVEPDVIGRIQLDLVPPLEEAAPPTKRTRKKKEEPEESIKEISSTRKRNG